MKQPALVCNFWMKALEEHFGEGKLPYAKESTLKELQGKAKNDVHFRKLMRGAFIRPTLRELSQKVCSSRARYLLSL